jgi:hypothetical protein
VKNGDWPSRSGVAKLLAGFTLTKPFAGFLGATSTADEQANHDLALAAVKSSLSAEARGNNLLYIIYRGDSTSTGITLVGGAIDTYQKENLGQTSTEAKACRLLQSRWPRPAEPEQADSDLRLEAEHPASPAAPGRRRPTARVVAVHTTSAVAVRLALNRQSDAGSGQASLTSDNDFRFRPAAYVRWPSLNLQRAAMLTFVGIVFIRPRRATDRLAHLVRRTVRRREDVKASSGSCLAVLPDVKKGGK